MKTAQEWAKIANTNGRGLDYTIEQIQTEAYNQALSEFRLKLISMRFTEDQIHEMCEESTIKAYGTTECINDLLEWIKSKESILKLKK